MKDELVGIQCEVDRFHKRLQHQFIQYPMTALVDLEIQPTKCDFYIHNTEEGFRDDRCTSWRETLISPAAAEAGEATAADLRTAWATAF